MRKALFISYWVPPRNGIGSVRCGHLLRHLAQYGWEVTALTARFPVAIESASQNYIQTDYYDLKDALKRALGIGGRSTHEALNVSVPQHGSKKSVLQHVISAAAVPVSYPDEHIGWLPFAVRAARKAISDGRFDAILSSGPPVTTNIIAALSHGAIPWVADLRDLWAENDSVDRSALRTLLDDRLERSCLSRAAALIASSELSARRFAQRYPHKPCFSINTGFDVEEWRKFEFRTEPQCTLVYAGTLYWGKRDPTKLFEALRRIFDEGTASRDELRVDFYGNREPWLLELIARFDLDGVVRVLGHTDRETVLAAERRADRLIVLSWDGPTAEGVVAGKLFEYFGARRPVLAIGGPADSSVDDLLRETGAGVRARTVEQVRAEVLSALAEHRAGNVRTVPEHAVSEYTGEHCARRFAEVLDYTVDLSTRVDGTRESHAATAIPANTAK